jgi:hypothetical protein
MLLQRRRQHEYVPQEDVETLEMQRDVPLEVQFEGDIPNQGMQEEFPWEMPQGGGTVRSAVASQRTSSAMV